MAAPRSREQRRADTLRKLGEGGADVWVATAHAGSAHLVPLSYAWHDDCVVIACEKSSLTARNIVGSLRARLGFGPTRDVVMIDAILERCEAVHSLDDEAVKAYEQQAGWDPRAVGNNVLMWLRPQRVQAWRESNEIEGRTLMRAGNWLA